MKPVGESGRIRRATHRLSPDSGRPERGCKCRAAPPQFWTVLLSALASFPHSLPVRQRDVSTVAKWLRKLFLAP